MTTTGNVEEALGDLAGTLIRPGHPDYDAARSVYNGMIDKSPALIAQVRTEEDVVLAVSVARKNGLLLAVRGGGHNGAGLGTCDG
jgi:FAD/FMN-containing dehydrogenase